MDIGNISPDNLPLAFVKQYLRVDHDFDDLEIQLMIQSAQSYIRNNLKLPKTEELDIEIVIPMLTLIAYFYENKTVIMSSKDKEDLIFGSILSLHRRDIL